MRPFVLCQVFAVAALTGFKSFLSPIALGWVCLYIVLAWMCSNWSPLPGRYRDTLRLASAPLVWAMFMLSINLFGDDYEGGPVVLVATIAFGAGFSMALFRTSMGTVRAIALALLVMHLALVLLIVSLP